MLWKKNSPQSTAIELFEKNEKILISERTINLSVKDALNSGAHFRVLKKWDEKGTTMLIATMLTELLMSVPNNMTSDQIVYMARSIVIDSENWKPDDILIIFRNGKQGKYGKIYGNFTYQTFNEWADAYAIERQNYVDNEHLKVKEPSTTREDNKHQIFREGKRNQPISLKDYFAR